ncbi:MAG: fimbrial protein [Herbaspirillum sp.]|jgi:type IV pilus assembly protein PilN|nr:fimbrial protein [Herbaspirillum sp.]
MMQFNLLPHRAQRRRRQRQRFLGMLALTALLGAALTGIGLYASDRQRQVQQARNDWLQHAQDALDAEIRHAITLQQETEALLAAGRKIESLRHDGGRATRLLAALAAGVPPDAYLRKMTQQHQRIALDGYAASNQTVAELLRSLSGGAGIASAQLIETRAENGGAAEALAFSVALTLKDHP